MSPEQAKGQKTDKRSDIWAFGAVLYEMLTGRHAFAAGDVPETVAAILRAEPDWNLLPANTPEAVRRVLRRCLARNPRERLQDIGDARLDLADVTAEAAQLPPAPPRRGERLLWSAGVGALALALVAVGVTRSRIPPSASPAYRFEIATPATTSPMSIALSPDARQIVYAANAASGRSQLFLRALDRTDTVPLGGTDGATYPFWSPDAKSIGFFAHNELRRLDLADSKVRKLADAPIGRGGTWNAAGTILFCPAGSGTLARIPASGGEAVVLTHTLPGPLASEFPRFLRDGIHFLFFAVGPREAGGVFVGSLDGSEPRRLVDSDAAAAVSNEYVYTIHHGRLFAQRLNQDALRVDAELMSIVDQILMDESHRAAVLSAADNGLLALRTGTPGQRRLAWFDRSDRLLDTINEPVDGSGYGGVVEISPDGRALATTANRDLWVYDFGRRVWSRLTTDPAIDSQPVWSADSRRIAFVRVRNESADIYVRSAEPGGSDEPLVVSPELKTPGGWSPDGEYFVFGATTPLGRASIYAIRAKGDRKPFPVDAGSLPRAVHTPRLSPDGHWLTFESDEIGSGRQELYIQRFPDSGGQRKRVSVAGGVMARWARDSHSLYYVSSDGALTTVSLRSGERGDIELGTPVPLFTPRWGTTFLNANPFSNPTPIARLYDVDPDGRRFLISELVKDPSYSPITLLMNWRPSHSNAH
jgi:Tol biopolymer transport system component